MATPTPEQMADPEFQRRLSEGLRNFDPQQLFSTLRSRGLAFVIAKAAFRRERRQQVADRKKRLQIHPRLVDEQRIAFDLIDGHFD